ncbi:3-oxoadipyl-CoA thiolase [Hyphococcus lacteus]|uniref:Beta-ketoadipyl-CoA thiolase n=1 Tax=Hyphococcus lacteus TaxID=3143536 RepID=A0ABV3Z4P2_9PROT
MTEVFICDGVRTPIGRFGGALSKIRPDDMAALVIREIVARTPHLNPNAIDDVILGCANQAGEDNRNVARMASLLAGLPESVGGMTVNRLCASGLDAIGSAARAIKAGDADLMIAGGVESMSRAPFVMAKSEKPFDRTQQLEDTTIGWRLINPEMREAYGVDSMPETAQNLADDHNISRDDQDRFALRSQQRVAASRDFFSGEIMPIDIGSPNKPNLMRLDEHPRDTSFESLGKLRPIARPDGSVTAGNSSGVNDGAAALILASAAAAEKQNLVPRARICGLASAGVAPRVMGIGPVPATKKLLDRLGWSIASVDIIELNEAFAAQSLAVLRGLGLPDDADHVNPHGGAIALGHPLGMSGARLALTALRALEKSGGKRAIVTLCVGVGQGLSLAMERVS